MISSDKSTGLLSKILDYIAHKPRTAHEVRTKLESYVSDLSDFEPDFDPDRFVEDTLEYIRSLNYINDVDYANRYVLEKINSASPSSKLEIKMFLRKKGVEDALIDIALESYDEATEKQIIATILSKGSRKNKDFKKNYAYLLRRGFSSYLVRDILSSN